MMNSDALFKLTYGLYVVTTCLDGRDNGCIVNTVIQAADEPKRISVAINKKCLTHDMIMKSKMLNVSVLTEKSSFETYKHWGFQSGRDTDKLVGIAYKRSENGLIYLVNEVNAYISGKVIDTVDLGTHTMFIADVSDCEILSDDESVSYSYYQKNIKKSQPEKKKGYICVICGYVYEGETLPDDFICPWCSHPASDFRKL